jgi:hypothetical protein
MEDISKKRVSEYEDNTEVKSKKSKCEKEEDVVVKKEEEVVVKKEEVVNVKTRSLYHKTKEYIKRFINF